MSFTAAGFRLAGCLAFATGLIAQGPFVLEIVYTNEAGHPQSAVPGMPGMSFRPGASGNAAFWRPVASGSGNHWGIRASIDVLSSQSSILLVDDAVLLQSGTPTPWPTGGELLGPMRETFAIDDSGDVLVTNNTSSFFADDYVAFFNGGVWTVLAQEAQSADVTLPQLTGGGNATWSGQLSGVQLSGLGPSWLDRSLGGLTTGTANNQVCVLGNGASFLQRGVQVPGQQAGGANAPWDQFDIDGLWVSPDGSVVVVQGNTTAPTSIDDIVTVNGQVVAHEGAVLPNSSFATPVDLNGIVKAWVDAGNHYYVRGNNDQTETDWVIRDGVVIADSSGSNPVGAGTGEMWSDQYADDCFSGFDGNAHGAYVLAGETDAAPNANGVLLFVDAQGNREIVWREGTPFDLDGNGVFDDDRYLSAIGTDDVLLLDDGSILFVATLRNGVNFDVSSCVFRLRPAGASCAVRSGSGANPAACTCLTTPVLGATWQLQVAPGPSTIATLCFAGSVALPAPFPLPFGELLIALPAIEIPGNITHQAALPPDPMFIGTPFFVQGVRLNVVGGALQLELTDGQDAVVGL